MPKPSISSETLTPAIERALHRFTDKLARLVVAIDVIEQADRPLGPVNQP